MRVPQEANFTVRDVRDSASTPLDNAQTKPKRRPKKYRAVARPDGIIVERPRYRPTSLPHNKTPKPNHTAVDSRMPTKQIGGVESSRMTYELLGIGISEINSSSENYGESTEDTGEGQGSIQVQHLHMHVEIEKYTVERQSYIERNTIDRFLHDGGPWSSYSQREAD